MKKRILSLLVASTFLIGSQVTPAKAGSDTEVIGTLIGAAVGGFIGSNVGKGKGQLAATAIGVLLGAGIGNTMATSEQGITNTVYNPQPRVVYQPRPPARRVVYVERPKTRVIYIKQKPRTKYVVIKRYGPPRHAKAYGHKKRHWKKQRRTSRRTVYYSKGGYRTVRTVSTRRNRS